MANISKNSYAPYTRRFGAFIVDWYFSSLFALLPVVFIQSYLQNDLIIENRIDTLPFWVAFTTVIVSITLYTVYYCVLPLKKVFGYDVGQTIGRRIFKIKLISNTGSLSFKQLLIREIMGVLLLQGVITSVNIYIMSLTQMALQIDVVPYFQSIYYLIAFISMMMLVVGKRKQTFHDFISKTKMV
jgi:uncharacterized RDD family membrane protein YckC